MQTKTITGSSAFRRLLLIGLCSCLAPVFASAQDKSFVNASDIRWNLDTVVQGVVFYHSITPCNGSNVVMLRFENRNQYPVRISWNENFLTKSEGRIAGAAGRKELTLSRGESTPSGCADTKHAGQIIRPGEIHPAMIVQILGFEFKDIIVNKND
jgi:hypothetical protein